MARLSERPFRQPANRKKPMNKEEAEIKLLQAQIWKVEAETAKVIAETDKLIAETEKI